MHFAQWLQSKMEQHNFSNYRIAKMAGVHQSTVAGWLAGSKPQAEKEKTVRNAIEDYEISIGVKTDDPNAKKIPAVSGEGDLGALIPGYSDLTAANKLKAQEYIALLLNSQQNT